MSRPRDSQRSRVYAWERHIKGYHRPPEWRTIDEVVAFARPIWRSERGRYGRPGLAAPLFESSSWGQTSALAHGDHRITLPLWARQAPVVLHEMAHHLTHKDEAHGPRFVGVLIGLLARHAGYVADELMALADEMGVRYNTTSIGSVPVRGPAWHVERAVREGGPMTEIELAVWCDLSYLQVRGAAMALGRAGTARWLRRKLVLLGAAAPTPPAPTAAPRPRKPAPEAVKAKAARYGMQLERTDSLWWVYPPAALAELYAAADDGADPYDDAHHCDTWAEVRAHVEAYAKEMDALLPSMVGKV